MAVKAPMEPSCAMPVRPALGTVNGLNPLPCALPEASVVPCCISARLAALTSRPAVARAPPPRAPHDAPLQLLAVGRAGDGLHDEAEERVVGVAISPSR